MSAVNAVALLAAAGGDYQISRSVRTRQSASAYFNRTAGVSPTSNQKGTFSFWIKRGLISYGTEQWLFAAGSSSLGCYFRTDDKLGIEYFGGSYLISTQVFRDPSAWYHIVFAVDSTQATSSNRAKLYVNGVQITSFGTEQYPTKNATINWIASGQACYINQIYIGGRYFDGYHTEFNYIDGQQLTPSSFGETDAITGVWKPKKYAGTYGTNGFYLNFSDNSNNTAATIGKDYSGNGNNWTPNNISVTAGATYDSMLDVPTQWADGGNGRGNYATLNPLISSTYQSLTNGNLTSKSNTSTDSGASYSTISTGLTGKWYMEFVADTSAGGGYPVVGTTLETSNLGTANGAAGIPGQNGGGSCGYRSNGQKYISGTSSSYGNSYVTNDVIGVAVDCDNGAVYFSKNGTWQNSGDPTSGATKTGAANTWTGGATAFYIGVAGYTSGNGAHANFGQRPFAYTPPTGFKALNTQNLPAPSILKGNQFFDVSLYTGDGSTTRSITGLSFAPDFLWHKTRSNADDHRLVDSVRAGGTDLSSSVLYSNLTNAQDNSSGYITQTSSGFNLGVSATPLNMSGRTYVAWQWKESATAGFDIVTFTNPSSGSSSFAHNLGVKPSMIIVKARSATSNWTTAHRSLGANMADRWINLESTAAAQTSTNIWGGEPTSSVFYCGTGIQVAGATMVAYLFAEVAGFSRFGSVTMNGSADGAFVFTGFLPKLVMLKRTDSTSNWIMWDTVRNTYNVVGAELYPNLSNAESTVTDLDILSNGFKMRNSGFSGTWIYAAWADSPFKNSLAR